MLLVRLVLALVLGRAIVSRSLLALPPAGPDGDSEAEPSPATPVADTGEADAAPGVAEASGHPAEAATKPDDGRKDRAPWLVRMSIAAAPLFGLIFFIVAVLALVDQNTDWRLPVGGGVEGEWPLAVLLISIGIWAVWLLWQVPRWQAASWRGSMELEEREIFDIENSSRATLGQILSGVAVLAGLIFAWQQLGNTSQNLFVSQEGQITDRFTRAVGQLGDDDLTIRLGGIYALERIARDSERDHETVMEILAAFARQRSVAEEQAVALLAAAASPGAVPVDGMGGAVSLTSVRAIPLDIDVVLKVISRRDSTRDGLGCIDLSDINLAGAQLGDSSLNLTNVCLRGADLRDSQLGGVDFAGADLAGADFTGAILAGANLSGAELTGANFTGANLDQANLTGAKMTSALFPRANLSLADLTGANLTGANLQTPGLQGTILRDAILNRTDFTGAVLSGADLQGANMLGAVLEGATLLGVDMRGVTNLTPEQLEAATFDSTTQWPPEIPATPDF